MLRKYIVVNTLTGYTAFNGRRFFTAKGAARKIRRFPWQDLLQLRKFI